jgi:ApaG protein
MKTNTASDTTTDGIRVIAEPVFQPFHSSENEKRFLFSYDISVVNEGSIGVTLRSRKWSIINSEGEEIIVRGEGVVGEQPFIAPGESYKYSSFCVLDTPFGTMEGFYILEREDGDIVQASIGRFYLNVPVNSVE